MTETKRPGTLAVGLGRLVRDPSAMTSGIGLLVIALCAWVIPVFWPYGYTDLTNDLSFAPSLSHPMGTDGLGRDLLSRVLRGVQESLMIATTVTLIGMFIGMLFGAIAGFLGGLPDKLIMRAVDLVLTIPIIAMGAFLGSIVPPGVVGWLPLSIVLGLLMWTTIGRLVRGMVLSLRELPYIDAARVMGAGTWSIVRRHLIPNSMDQVIAAATILFGVSLLVESALSFLGFGVQPPDTSLGTLVADARSAVLTRPWLFYFPGGIIVVIVLCVNYLGESIRRAFNPAVAVGNNPLVSGGAVTRPSRPVGATAPSGVASVSGLTVRFGNEAVVDNVDLIIEEGSCLALVGESGSGKTLTATSLVGLLPESARWSGVIRFRGDDVTDLNFSQWRKIRGTGIGMIQQDPTSSLNPVLTIGRQFADCMRVVDAKKPENVRQRACDVMASLSISDPETRFDQYPHQLSGGLRQRIAIALCMIQDPDLVIADEPTTALDVTVQAEVMAALNVMRERTGAAMLFISHDLALVAGVADRVAVMSRGQIVEEQTAEQLYLRPESDYTRMLLDTAPRIDRVQYRAVRDV